jgi:hypothetical protein
VIFLFDILLGHAGAISGEIGAALRLKEGILTSILQMI